MDVNKTEVFDSRVELLMMENVLSCDLYLTESTGNIQKIIDRIKQMLNTIKRKIQKIINISSFDTKKNQIIDRIKKDKFLRFKQIDAYDLKRVYSMYIKALNDIQKSDEPDLVFEDFTDALEDAVSRNKTYRIGDLVKDICISKYIDIINQIDEETDKQNHIYSKLMKNEDENEDDIGLVVERLRTLSKLTTSLNKEISKELQLVSIVLKYDV